MRKQVCTLSTRLSGGGNERTLPNQGLDIAVEKKIPGTR
jgi:hypothetical protein